MTTPKHEDMRIATTAAAVHAILKDSTFRFTDLPAEAPVPKTNRDGSVRKGANDRVLMTTSKGRRFSLTVGDIGITLFPNADGTCGIVPTSGSNIAADWDEAVTLIDWLRNFLPLGDRPDPEPVPAGDNPFGDSDPAPAETRQDVPQGHAVGTRATDGNGITWEVTKAATATAKGIRTRVG